MSGREPAAGVHVLVSGEAGAGACELGRALDAPLLVLGEIADLEALLGEVERSNVVWLHPWTRDAASLAPAARQWFASARAPAVARAAERLVWGRGSISLGRAIVFSTPASCEVRSGRPVARSGATETGLDRGLDLEAPLSLEAHLRAINDATSLAADLGQAAEERASWRGLLWRPLWIALRGLVSARGARREALPRIALEAFRETLTTVKLWESRFASPIAPPSLPA
ncbi:MAG TPA: hypothetical protein VEI94_15245 [Candidatus Bathyarchaeia archaeon]|nr:hypothetical protein [Candidatus Bathyarchaeia archaeon]